MTPGRHLSARKRQVAELVEALDEEGWNAEEIGEAIGYTGTHVRNILRYLGRSRRPPLAERIARLPAQKRRRLELWRQLFFESETFPASRDLKIA